MVGCKNCQFYSGNFHFFLQPTVRFIRVVHSQSTLQRLLQGEIFKFHLVVFLKTPDIKK
jgi:hypothetical protein